MSTIRSIIIAEATHDMPPHIVISGRDNIEIIESKINGEHSYLPIIQVFKNGKLFSEHMKYHLYGIYYSED